MQSIRPTRPARPRGTEPARSTEPARGTDPARRAAQVQNSSVPFIPQRPRRSRTRPPSPTQDREPQSRADLRRADRAPADLPRTAQTRSARSPSAPRFPAARPTAARTTAIRERRARPPRIRRRLRGFGLPRLIRRFRILLALILGLGAAGAAALTGAEGQAETTHALRASADIGAGERLSAALVEDVQVDVTAVPRDYSAETGQVLGRQAAVPIPAGALIHPEQLVGPGLLAGQDPGTVAVPVRPADPAMVALLTPGQRVDVLASSDTPERGTASQLVATAAPVLWTPRDDSENWLPSGSEAGGVVILAVDPATAGSIAQATQEGRLHLSLRGTGPPPSPDQPEISSEDSAGGAR